MEWIGNSVKSSEYLVEHISENMLHFVHGVMYHVISVFVVIWVSIGLCLLKYFKVLLMNKYLFYTFS